MDAAHVGIQYPPGREDTDSTMEPTHSPRLPAEPADIRAAAREALHPPPRARAARPHSRGKYPLGLSLRSLPAMPERPSGRGSRDVAPAGLPVRAWALTAALCTLTIAPSLPADTHDPLGTVRRYYDALQNERCEDARTLNPRLTLDECQAYARGARVDAWISSGSASSGIVVSVALVYPLGSASSNQHAELTLKQWDSRWVITRIAHEDDDGIGNRRALWLPEASPDAAAIGAGSRGSGERLPPGVIDDPRRGLIEPPPPRGMGFGADTRRDDSLGRAPVEASKELRAPPLEAPPRLWPNPSLPDSNLGGASLDPLAGPPALGPQGPGSIQPLWEAPGGASSFGSEALLNACWAPSELRGRRGERKIRALARPDHSPPTRPEPLHPYPPLRPELARSLRSVELPPGDMRVALTFDLCEQADELTGYDGRLVDILREHDVRATFFAGGKWMRSHPERTQQLMADPRFEVGNHAWTHGNMRVLRGREMEAQIHWTQAQYEILRDALLARPCARPFLREADNAIPFLPRAFRYPYGTCNRASLDAVASAGLYPVQWSVVTGDPSAGQSAENIVSGVLRKLAPGAVIIAHANGRGWHTAEALEVLIPAIRERGFEFATVSELIEGGRPRMVETCYESKPGDNLRYDRLFGKGTE